MRGVGTRSTTWPSPWWRCARSRWPGWPFAAGAPRPRELGRRAAARLAGWAALRRAQGRPVAFAGPPHHRHRIVERLGGHLAIGGRDALADLRLVDEGLQALGIEA